MINVGTERILNRSESLAFIYKITGKRPNPNSWDRWRQKGLSGVVLETIFISGTFYTSAEALNRFFNAVAESKSQSRSLPATKRDKSPQSTDLLNARAIELGI